MDGVSDSTVLMPLLEKFTMNELEVEGEKGVTWTTEADTFQSWLEENQQCAPVGALIHSAACGPDAMEIRHVR